MSDVTCRPNIAVVIATKDRGALLTERALASVAAQTRIPDQLVVADDSSPHGRHGNRDIVTSVSLPNCRVTYLENKRTAGASGSWNTAIDFLHRQVENPADLFVAILDDDDAWAPDYIERCLALAHDQALDMVAADILRFETTDDAPVLNEAPESLRASDFLTGNPGIQGSNLFVRLSVLLAAGAFDEEFRSTTDRDICIRIADLGTVRYGHLALPLVRHYADAGRARLSTRGSELKLDGLTTFWQKYGGRMTSAQRAAFSERARVLFDWCPQGSASFHAEAIPKFPRVLGFEHMVRRTFLACRQSNPPDLQLLMRRVLTDVQFPEMSGYSRFRAKFDAHTSRVPGRAGVTSAGMSEAPAHDPFALYVGVISSDPAMLRPLLDGLAGLRSSPSIERLAAVVLDNGTPAPRLQKLAEDARRAGLQVAVISEPIQRRDAASGAFGAPLRERPSGQVGIAQARTMLQRYLGTLLSTNHGAFGWILDDDMRVDDRALTYLPWLPAFRGDGVDVLIGQYEGSSPNPPINGLRVHLVDLLHNLIWLRGLQPNAILPDRTTENAALRARYPDYYYDLSRKHTGHLEMPHWLEPVARGETVGEAHARLLAGALGILSGDPLTRPIVASMPANPLASAKDSVNRGGCTFILNHRALTLTPNTTPRIRGREARRSDMIWAIVNRYYRRLQIKAVGFPIQHVGRVAATPSLSIEKVQGEIIGSSLYAGLTEFLGDKPHHELDFSSEETEAIGRLASERLSHRMRSLEQSFYRIAGLREAIRRAAKPGELEDLHEYLGIWFTPETFARILSGVRAQTQDDVERFLISLRNIADDYASATVDTRLIHDQLRFISGDERQAQHQ